MRQSLRPCCAAAALAFSALWLHSATTSHWPVLSQASMWGCETQPMPTTPTPIRFSAMAPSVTYPRSKSRMPHSSLPARERRARLVAHRVVAHARVVELVGSGDQAIGDDVLGLDHMGQLPDAMSDREERVPAHDVVPAPGAAQPADLLAVRPVPAKDRRELLGRFDAHSRLQGVRQSRAVLVDDLRGRGRVGLPELEAHGPATQIARIDVDPLRARQ